MNVQWNLMARLVLLASKSTTKEASSLRLFRLNTRGRLLWVKQEALHSASGLKTRVVRLVQSVGACRVPIEVF